MARRRSAPHDPSIGERIKESRLQKGWSVRKAADRAGVSHTTWSRVEKGEIAVNRYTISDYAAALECSVKDLTGQPYAHADQLLEAGAIYSDRAWKAMMAHPLTEPADVDPRPLPALAAEAALIRDLYARCDYAGTLGRATGFIAPLHASARNGNARDAMLLMVPVYGCVMGSLLNLGRPAEALLAADRSAEAAQELDDAVALGVATTNRARVSAYSGAYSTARLFCERADDHLQHHLGASDALAVSGFLHLARAHHSAGLHDMDTAEAHLAAAADIAQRTGETDAWDLAWGPRNVALWRMAMQLDTHRPDEAMQTAATVRLAGLPAVRQVYYHIDRARGLTELGHTDQAISALLMAERTGKQHTRSSTAARETARSLRTVQRRLLNSSPLQGLCERMGVAN